MLLTFNVTPPNKQWAFFFFKRKKHKNFLICTLCPQSNNPLYYPVTKRDHRPQDI